MNSVIIIDDDSNSNAFFAKCINNNSHFEVVATACSGHEGMLAIEHYRPHLVIMDIMMPDKDGLKVIKHIRENCGQYNPFIYIITAMNTPTIEKMLIDLEVDFYDFKPVDVEELAGRLDYIRAAKPKEKKSRPKKPEKKDAADVVEDILCEIGVPQHLHGSDYIKTSLFFMLDNPHIKRNIYSKVSSVFNCSPENVKKNIKTAVESGMDSELYKALFGKERAENLVFLFALSSLVSRRMKGNDEE